MGLCTSKEAVNASQPTTNPHTKLTSECTAVSSCSTRQYGSGRSKNALQSEEDSNSSERSDGSKASVSRWSDLPTEFSGRKNNFMLDTFGRIKEVYSLDKQKLGAGAYGYVTKGTSLESGSTRAIKKVSKSRGREVRNIFMREVHLLKATDHPGIVKLYETFEDQRHMYLVLELCQGGDLFQRLMLTGPFSEAQAAVVMRQLLETVFYLHDHKGICHRDLKPENCLLLRQAPVEVNRVKVADFGLSCSFESGQVLTTKLGTAKYCSPQVLAGSYDQSADLWSCGVILYILLCAEPPFGGKNDAEVIQHVRKGNYAFKQTVWNGVSENAKDFIRKLLKYQPWDRLSAEQALHHDWMEMLTPRPQLKDLIRPETILELNKFCRQSTFRRGALCSIALQLEEEHIKEPMKTFAALDSRGIGVLTVERLEELCQNEALSKVSSELKQVIEDLKASVDGHNVISYTDFIASTLDSRKGVQDGPTRAAFRVFDRDGDGFISSEELQTALGVEHYKAVEMIREVDANNDGQIDYSEFKRMVNA